MSAGRPGSVAAEPLIDVIIAMHDIRRPIGRAVASVIDGAPAGSVRVTVVCHGLPAGDVLGKLGEVDGERVRLVEFADGVRSAAGPFNHGLSIATAEYVSVMGSDDFLEPGAVSRWADYVRAEDPDVALVRLRFQDGATLHNPLARARRRRRLHPVKDRLFYRTAPLGLLRRTTVNRLGLRMTEGLRTGEDLAFSVKLWTSGVRIDYLASLPAYVIGSDAEARVTTAPMSPEEFFAPVTGILSDPYAVALDPPTRRSLAIKLTRIHLLGYVLARPTVDDWPSDAAVRHVSRVLAALLRFAPRLSEPFPRADRDLFDALLEPAATRAGVVAAIGAHRTAGRRRGILPRSLWHVLDRESVVSRYILYATSR